MNINPQSHQAYYLFQKGILALSRAEQAGIRIDMEYAESKKKHIDRMITRAEAKFKETKLYSHWCHTVKSGAPNMYSSQQLGTFLYKVKKIEAVKTTTSGFGSTDEEALEAMNLPELAYIIEAKKLKKIRDTYLEAFLREQVDGYIHPSFNLHLVKTFRSSSDSPNFQNIPVRDAFAMQTIRSALFARPGHQLLEVDLGSAEVRVAACYHKDPVMLSYINDPTTDMHGDMAKEIFILPGFNKKDHKVLRNATKNGFVFPEFYGDYYKNCAVNIGSKWMGLPNGKWKPGQGVAMPEGTISDHLISQGIKSMDDFTEHMKDIEDFFWNKRFRVYAQWKDRWWKQYQKDGFVDSLTGFRFNGVMNKKDVINYPVQGAAFHCLLWSLTRLTELSIKEKWKSRIIGQIHDSIIFDLHPKEREYVLATVKRVFTVELPAFWDWIIVPIEIEAEIAEVDQPWSEKKKVEGF